MIRLRRSGIRVTSAGFVLAMTGCGSGAKIRKVQHFPIDIAASATR
jgi:hypothetical protein